MMWITPLLASISAFVTLALLIITPPEPMNTSTSAPSTVLIISWSLRSLEWTEPEATWYVRTAWSSLMFLGSNRWSRTSLGSLANASLVGANTVKGPGPERVSTNCPAFKAATRVERSGVATAISTIVWSAATYLGGSSTVSMMWITPLLASISAFVTLALLIITPPEPMNTSTSAPSTVLII